MAFDFMEPLKFKWTVTDYEVSKAIKEWVDSMDTHKCQDDQPMSLCRDCGIILAYPPPFECPFCNGKNIWTDADEPEIVGSGK